MSAITKIQWSDRTWNAVRGCSRVSPGCDHCYAMGQAHRFAGPGKPYEGLTTIRKGKVDWTGVARLVPSALDEPLRWKKPQRIFVNSMSDLFHHSLTNEEIAAVFGVMAAAPQHTFQVLTKRPERMVEWFKWEQERHATKRACVVTAGLYCRRDLPLVRYERLFYDAEYGPWPLPNVWIGVSIENQATVDERIPLLLKTPATVRFISAEPLLGRVDLSHALHLGRCKSIGPKPDKFRCGLPAGHRGEPHSALHPSGSPWFGTRPVDWIIAGGESGPGARPCALEWLESIVEQCRESGTACFVKQLGACVVSEHRACDTDEEAAEKFGFSSRWLWRAGLQDKKGGDPSEWSQELQVRQFPEVR